MAVEPKIGGFWTPPKMDGESNGSKPYEQMDDLGGNTPIFGNAYIYIYIYISASVIGQLTKTKH